ncbi:MAG: dimethylsulfonioproprionate lyase family protein [Pseudomonadota bacterium]
MKNRIASIAIAFVAGIVLTTFLTGNVTVAANSKPANVENLFRSELTAASDIEVIISVIDIGPHTEFPKHYHPGEEFVYLLEGSATTWFQDADNVDVKKGDFLHIPFKAVHTAITKDTSARALIFRVHKKGEPEVIPVE